MAQLTEAYLKKMIRQVLKEENLAENFGQFEIDNMLSVDEAAQVLSGIKQGRKPTHSDLNRVIALLYKLDGRTVTTKHGQPAYKLA